MVRPLERLARRAGDKRGLYAVLLVVASLAAGGAAVVAAQPKHTSADFSASRGLAEWDLDGGGVWRMRDGVGSFDETAEFRRFDVTAR